jgi:hypothetical protein
MFLCRVLRRIDVGFASREQDCIATLDQLYDFRGRLIEANAHRFSAGHCDRPLVLRQSPVSVRTVTRMRDWNSNARSHISKL